MSNNAWSSELTEGGRKPWEQHEQAQPAASTNCWCGRWNTKAEGGRGGMEMCLSVETAV